MQKIYFGMGCFWKPEEQFKNIKGILATEVGYAGGYKSKVITKKFAKETQVTQK